MELPARNKVRITESGGIAELSKLFIVATSESIHVQENHHAVL